MAKIWLVLGQAFYLRDCNPSRLHAPTSTISLLSP